jgi:hypothetical protein
MAPTEREARLKGILHISQKPHLSGSPVKQPSPRPPPFAPLAVQYTRKVGLYKRVLYPVVTVLLNVFYQSILLRM